MYIFLSIYFYIWTCVSEINILFIYSSPPLQRTLLYPSKSVPTLRVSPQQGDRHSGMDGGGGGGASFMGMKNALCTVYM